MRQFTANRGKLALVGTGLALCTLAVPSGIAFANAANPCGTSLTAGACPPGNAGGSGTISSDPQPGFSQAVKVTVSGYWSWADCAKVGMEQCSGQPTTAATGPFGPGNGCMNGNSPGRSGVGWAMIWNDPDDLGFTVSQGNISEGVGSVGSALNPADEGVHIQLATPCGPTDNKGIVKVGNQSYPSGQWGPISHVYESASDVPSQVCVNMYDPHGDFSIGDVDHALNDFNAVGNHDNSIQTNSFDPTIGGGSCFSPTPQTGVISGHIYLCNNGSQTTTEQTGGTITFSNETAMPNPVSISVPFGTYGATASAPSGDQFVQCGSTNYTINSSGTATYTNGIRVAAGVTGSAIFYVQPVPQTGLLNGHIYLCSNGAQTTTEQSGGTITFTGHSAMANPVSLTVSPGTYGASASAPAGYQFVQCGSTNYTITNGTATYNNPVTVTTSTPGTAVFYVQATPPPPGPNFVVSKSVSPSGSVPINTDLTYTVTVMNTGQVAGVPGQLVDTLAASGGATCAIKVAATVTAGTVTSPSGCPGSWTWDLSSPLAANDSATLTVVITALTPGTLTNVAVLPGSNCTGSTAPPCGTNTPVNLLLTKTVAQGNGATVPLNSTLNYTITLINPTQNPATNVVMTDVMSGSAGVTVNTGSFMANPAVVGGSVTCQVSSCTSFTWTWATVPAENATTGAPGEATLTYSAVITSPGTVSSTVNSVTLVNTVSTQGLPPATVSNNAPLPVSSVKAASTPSTGGFPRMNVSIAGFMFLGGLGLILLGLLARKPRFDGLQAG